MTAATVSRLEALLERIQRNRRPPMEAAPLALPLHPSGAPKRPSTPLEIALEVELQRPAVAMPAARATTPEPTAAPPSAPPPRPASVPAPAAAPPVHAAPPQAPSARPPVAPEAAPPPVAPPAAPAPMAAPPSAAAVMSPQRVKPDSIAPPSAPIVAATATSETTERPTFGGLLTRSLGLRPR